MKGNGRDVHRAAGILLALSLLWCLSACDKENTTVNPELDAALSWMQDEVARLSLALDALPEGTVRNYVYVGQQSVDAFGTWQVFEVYTETADQFTLVSRYALGEKDAPYYAFDLALDRWFPIVNGQSDAPRIDRSAVAPNYDDPDYGLNFHMEETDRVEVQENSTQVLRTDQFFVWILTYDETRDLTSTAAKEEPERLYADGTENPQFSLGNFAWSGPREDVSLAGSPCYARSFEGYFSGTRMDGVFYYGNFAGRYRWASPMMGFSLACPPPAEIAPPTC